MPASPARPADSKHPGVRLADICPNLRLTGARNRENIRSSTPPEALTWHVIAACGYRVRLPDITAKSHFC
jgi:hypothetical protein